MRTVCPVPLEERVTSEGARVAEPMRHKKGAKRKREETWKISLGAQI
jgi:hypothetical protein